MNSCGTCKWFCQQTEDHGYCEYPVPAWLIISIGSPGRDAAFMPTRYAPCQTYGEIDCGKQADEIEGIRG